MRTPKKNWKTLGNFGLLKMAVEESIFIDKVQITILTDRTIPERTLRIIVPTLSGILKKYVKFEDITVDMVYPTQAGYCGILSIINRDFLKDIVIEKDKANC